MNRKLKNYNEIKYGLSDTSKGLPTFWTGLLVTTVQVGLWTLVLWLGSMLIHGVK